MQRRRGGKGDRGLLLTAGREQNLAGGRRLSARGCRRGTRDGAIFICVVDDSRTSCLFDVRSGQKPNISLLANGFFRSTWCGC